VPKGFRFLFLFAVLFIAAHCGRAQAKEVSAEFDQANKLYEEGKYSEAAAVYEKAVKTGQVSAALCFNLGNALFKAGQPGRALVWYRRAEALSPRDPDIQANLQFVRKNVTSGVNTRNWSARLQKLSLNEWTLLTVAALWLWFVLLALREWKPKLRPALLGYTSIVGMGGALLGICLALTWYDYTHTTAAVVVVAEAVVRRGPLDESQSFYTLRDGSEITVLDRKNERKAMRLPFSRVAFLDVFEVYNTVLWPCALVLWLATALAFIAHVRGRDRSAWTFGLLAVLWAWAAIAYHLALFTGINPAAWIFAVVFLVEAGLLASYGIRGGLRFSRGHTLQERVAYALIIYGLLYPVIALIGAHSYPRVPSFGVPCPTTIVTAGFLMLVSRPLPAVLTIVPLLWAVVGGSAAFLLGMYADLALLASGVALGVCTLSQRRSLVRS
jgi:tetratricopeptide (TPR) repeat protein